MVEVGWVGKEVDTSRVLQVRRKPEGVTVPKDCCTLRNKKGIATVREWDKWKEKMECGN